MFLELSLGVSNYIIVLVFCLKVCHYLPHVKRCPEKPTGFNTYWWDIINISSISTKLLKFCVNIEKPWFHDQEFNYHQFYSTRANSKKLLSWFQYKEAFRGERADSFFEILWNGKVEKDLLKRGGGQDYGNFKEGW